MAVPRQAGGHVLGRLGVEVGDKQAGAARRQDLGEGGAEAAGAAGDDDGASADVEKRVHARQDWGGGWGGGGMCISSRASSALATSRPSSRTMRTARSTSWALLSARTPGP